MQFLNLTREAVTGFVRSLTAAWWVEITTAAPRCTYYFGPFADLAEANYARLGYVEDLTGEGAEGITVTVKRCQPQVLTTCDSEAER